MNITLTLNDELVAKARSLTGLGKNSALVNAAAPSRTSSRHLASGARLTTRLCNLRISVTIFPNNMR
jgi:hypothetical protein